MLSIIQSYAVLTEAEHKAYAHFKEKLGNFEGVEDIYDNVRPDEE